MPLIINKNTTITGTVKYSQDIQLGPGVTLTVPPGAKLDLDGHGLLNFGTLVLDGSSTAFASLTSGIYSTESTSGVLTSNFGLFQDLTIDGFFSSGSIALDSSVLINSNFGALQRTRVEDSLFINSAFGIGIETDLKVTRTTFKNSLVSSLAWPSLFGEAAEFAQSNFISDGIAIRLDPFFVGGHSVSFSGNYMYVPAGSTFEDKVYDRDDNLRVATDISAASFVSQPYLTSTSGLSVGSFSLSLTELGLAIPVNQNFVGTSGADTLTGTAGPDVINGNAGDDRIIGLGGGDVISGGAGIDTVVYANDKGDYLVSKNPATGAYKVISKTGVFDSVGVDVEKIEFRDGTMDPTNQKYYGESSPMVVGSVSSVYRFFNTSNNSFFFTSSVSERDAVLANSDVSRNNVGEWPYVYQGSSFEAAHTYIGAVVLERFFNTNTRAHFFTSNAGEAATVKANAASGAWPFVYEGASYMVCPNDPTPNLVGSEVAVQRFYSPTLDRHWFTADPSEITLIRLTGIWNDEGVAFWGERPGP